MLNFDLFIYEALVSEAYSNKKVKILIIKVKMQVKMKY